jgi:predicted permease
MFTTSPPPARVDSSAMATPERRYGPAGGFTLGGIIVIVGIILMFVWSFWIGLIITLIGLIAFGGFARGRWY